MSTKHTLKLSSMLDTCLTLWLFRTCTATKVVKHQTRGGETLKNKCEPPQKKEEVLLQTNSYLRRLSSWSLFSSAHLSSRAAILRCTLALSSSLSKLVSFASSNCSFMSLNLASSFTKSFSNSLKLKTISHHNGTPINPRPLKRKARWSISSAAVLNFKSHRVQSKS